MIVYKVDPTQQTDANDEIRAMGAVLSEIAPTLRILRDLLEQHQESLNIPSLDSYRKDLLNMIPEAIRLAHLISINSQRLSSVSEQASKQLQALDSNVRAALVSKSGQTAPVPQAQGTTKPRETHSARLFQRQS